MKKIEEMTLKEKLGQLIMAGFESDYYDEHARTLIEDYKVSNIILFSRNVSSIDRLIKLNKKLYQAIIKSTGTIPFISIDQEGGMVTRLMNGATFCPGNMTISSTQDPKNAYDIGSIMGEELCHLGINLNLAPSLDTNNNPLNPVIGVRSYSDDPKIVANFGNAYIKGLQEKGVLATAKHFPGHGDTNVDSHLGLPVIEYDMERLNNIELVPFKSAIKNGVKAIMSAHIIFKTLDDVPATLSEKVLTGLLRKQLGFDGLIVSDCMQMKAIDNLYTTSLGVVMAIKAGLNIACISHSLEKQIASLKELENAIINGKIPMEIIDERVNRVLRFKNDILEKMNSEFISKEENELISYFKSIDKHKEEAQLITDQSITLIKGNGFIKKGKTIVIGNVPFASTIAEDKLNSRSVLDMIELHAKDIDTYKIDINPENINEIVENVKGYNSIVLISYNINSNKNQALLANELQKICDNFYVISSRNPYDSIYLTNINNIICLYEYTPVSINSIVKYLNGEISEMGELPVNVNRRLPIGASIYLGLKDYSLQDNLKYLELLKKKHINYVFISAHMEEADSSFISELKYIINYAKDNKFKIILDVNKNRLLELEGMGLTDGINTMRLDYGFSKEEILEYSNKPYYIELNASTISPSLLKYLKDNNADFSRYRLSHNFYPKPYTGLSYEKIMKLNEYYHSYGFSVMIYMPTFTFRRPPLYLGLPTIENQRYNNVIANVSELILAGNDIACFGDAFATEEEIDEALNHTLDVVMIPICIKKGISDDMKNSLLRNHSNRPDNSDYMIRSSVRSKNIIEFNCVEQHKKDITIDNLNLKRYQGEIGIVLKDMPASEGVNVIGHCLCDDFLVDSIKGGMRFKFIIVKEED